MADEDVPKKKKPTESTGAAPEGPTAQETEARKNIYSPESARQRELGTTGAGRLQEAEASKGSYAGLGLADRAAAERMVRSGEAKDRDEAAGMIRKRKAPPKPPAAVQAGALEKP
jgi:hypothetical protein